jgi:hypothetical protein
MMDLKHSEERAPGEWICGGGTPVLATGRRLVGEALDALAGEQGDEEEDQEECFPTERFSL